MQARTAMCGALSELFRLPSPGLHGYAEMAAVCGTPVGNRLGWHTTVAAFATGWNPARLKVCVL